MADSKITLLLALRAAPMMGELTGKIGTPWQDAKVLFWPSILKVHNVSLVGVIKESLSVGTAKLEPQKPLKNTPNYP